jgi:hypothetical protein
MYITEEGSIKFTPSKIPTKDEIQGNNIINSINFDENEES